MFILALQILIIVSDAAVLPIEMLKFFCCFEIIYIIATSLTTSLTKFFILLFCCRVFPMDGAYRDFSVGYRICFGSLNDYY